MSKIYVGVVEDRNDPLFLGRVKVRIFGINSPSKLELPTSDLPWTSIRGSTTSATLSGVGISPNGILPGTWVRLECLDEPDMQQWCVIGTCYGYDSPVDNPVNFGGTNVDGSTNTNPVSNPAPQQTPIPTPTPLTPNTSTWTLGQTSAQYESGGRGPGTINTYLTSNDPGGASYGSYQFASYLPLTMPNGKTRKGYAGSAMESYIASSSWSSRFTGLSPATSAWDSAWKQIATESSTDFETEQHAYIQAHFYNVMLNSLKRKGLDLTGFGPGVQDLIWSTAVQFGPGKTSIFLTPLANQTGLTDVSIVTQVSDYKISTYSTWATRYTSEKASLLTLCNGAVVPVTKDEAKTVTPDPTVTPAAQQDSLNQNNNFVIQAANVGFTDPSNTYPTTDYINLPDTNKLAYGVETGTQSADKTSNLYNGALLPNGNTFDQPSNPYQAQYPYNKVFESESGHLVEIDDTPGAERINIYHKSGTFVEVDAIGNCVRRVIGSDFTFTDTNSYVAIDGKMNISVGGSANIMVGADANIEIAGNTTLNCGNNIVASAGGRFSMSSAVAIDLKAPEIYIDADNSIDMKSGGYINIDGGGQVSILSGDTVAIDGSSVAVMSGEAVSASLSQGVEASGATDYTEVIMPDKFTNKLAAIAQNAEIPEEVGNVPDVHAALINSGLMTAAQLAKPGITSAVDATPTPPANNNTTVDCVYINTLADIPNTFQLSPNYQLADLSTKALAGSHQVVAQGGLTVSQIVCNLYQLAINVMEPLKQKWPNVKINSGFRTVSGSISTSSHPKGQAVDIHFDGFTPTDYLNCIVEIKQLLNGAYDQLILESLPGGHNWIHIGYVAGNNRGACFTMWNNKTYAQGFVLVS
jgi:uncharacterized protein YcbK (DUF882 family)